MERPAFHAGEIALQRQVGADARLAAIGPAVIREHMPQQHRDFFGQLPFLVAGALDAEGQPWASVLAGPPGFIASPHERALVVQAVPSPQDPLHAALAPGAPVGLLGIEPHTRRRNRMNGVVTERRTEGFSVAVSQSFGNCPKYIQARRPEFLPGSHAAPPVHRSAGLDAAARRAIAQADTFFIASAHPQADAVTPSFGVDVSHRGGKPGFVRVEGDTLTVPDFVGNNFFNTLGNLALNPRCGLLFIDFETGDLLQLAARGEIVTEGEALRSFAGAQRLLRLQVHSGLRREAALPLRWGPAQLSPHLQATGAWSQAS
ncbi:MAG: flavin-nucleotide-binding protein [Comamonadaceae bacterium]|nr:MAG: flavin-nucleotide-binding protein [Comamonadaceae bacterium]